MNLFRRKGKKNGVPSNEDQIAPIVGRGQAGRLPEGDAGHLSATVPDLQLRASADVPHVHGAPHHQPMIFSVQPQTVGLSDQPSSDDLINVEPYAEGLARFIGRCPTPMTIAVQGDWGSGKTSTLRMLKGALRDDTTIRNPTVIDFDTWQHAQVASGDGLVTDMVRAILEPLPSDVHGQRDALLKRLALASVRVANAGARVMLETAAPGAVSAMGNAVLDEIQGSVTSWGSRATVAPDPTLSDTRKEFAALIRTMSEQSVAEGRNPRVVVIVDDLDRLQPEQSVEVMEALKAFLDVEHCVFVLAIDFDVVVAGVTAKYKNISPRKARAFFDKIIQLPFRMPTQRYDMRKLISESLAKIEVDEGDFDVDSVAGVATAALGHNPRAIKRLLNHYALLREIDDVESDDDDDVPTLEEIRSRNTVLLASLAVQSEFPSFYNSLLENPAEFAATIQTACDESPKPEWEIDTDDSVRFQKVMSAFLKALPSSSGAESNHVLEAVARITEVVQVTPGRRIEPGRFAMTEEEQRARLEGVTEKSTIEIGESLRAAIRDELHGQPFSVIGQAGHGDEWTLQALEQSEEKNSHRQGYRFGLLKFNKKDVVLQLEASAKDDEEKWREVQVHAKEVAEQLGLRLGTCPGNKRVRLLGISTPEQVAAAAKIAAEGYAIRKASRGD